jgi:hypothetical protein
MEQLLGDEVYHYHSKLSAKEPRVGGAWEWHQDYGYWYLNGCLFPEMASIYIALDAATRENGCLQVIRGSHHIGRIEHGRFGDQTGADPERVQAALDRLACSFMAIYCMRRTRIRATNRAGVSCAATTRGGTILIKTHIILATRHWKRSTIRRSRRSAPRGVSRARRFLIRPWTRPPEQANPSSLFEHADIRPDPIGSVIGAHSLMSHITWDASAIRIAVA